MALCNKYEIEILENRDSTWFKKLRHMNNVKIRINTRIITDIKIQHNRPDLFVYDKKRKEITLIEAGITNLYILTQIENKMTKKNNFIANELALSYKCKVKIIPNMMTWKEVVTKYHKKNKNEMKILLKTEAYIQSLVLKKALESISFETKTRYRRGR